MAVCHAGLPSAVGPRPGEFTVGTVRLRPVSSAELRHLVAERTNELDQAAARAPGLAWLVAAALQDRGRPLAVQLPSREIAEPPADSRQAALLWGLRRITGPLLTGLDDQQAGARDWSFSTFEPPLGKKDPAALPCVVFRAQQDAQPATSTREETLVRPSDQRPVTATDYDGVAELLVYAFEIAGGADLAEWLKSHFARYQRPDDRFRFVYQALHKQYEADAPAAVVAAKPAPPRQQAEPGRQAEQAAPASWPAAAADADGNLAAELAAAAVATDPMTPDTASIREEAADGPRATTAPPRDHEQATDRPGALTSLLLRLDSGPGPDFDAALRAIVDGHFPSSTDRAAARQLLVGRGWFLLPLLQRDARHYMESLEVIFRRAVIPDLDDQEVIAELSRWADDYAAPHEVIVALDAAAQRAGYTAPELMSAMLPSLGRRWMIEHGVRAGLQAALVTAASPGSKVPRSPAPQPEQTQAPGMFARERLRDTATLLQFVLFTCNILLLILLLNSVIS